MDVQVKQFHKINRSFSSKKETILNVALLAVSFGFYLLFPLLDGPIWCVDSASYVSMDISREPLYPIFLALMRKVSNGSGDFGQDSLFFAVILQSLLAGFATWLAGLTIKKVKNKSIVLQLATMGFQFAVTLICRFAAVRGSAYTDCIMTEGLGFSLFVLFTLELYLYVNTDKKRCLAETLLLSFLLVSLRKQMLITLLIMVMVFFWYFIIRDKKIRKFCCLVGLIAGVFISCKLTDRVYNYVVRGAWIEHYHNSMGFLCTLLYSSDLEKDSKLFQDEKVKELYLEIMSQVDEKQLHYRYAGQGWLTVCEHFANSYDAIGYGIINSVVEGYIEKNYNLTYTELAQKYDEICGLMSKTLIKQSVMPMARVYTYNIGRGFVNSIARATYGLCIYAVIAYVCMAAISGCLVKWRRAGIMRDQIQRSLSFVFIVILEIAINTLVVGMTIFTQPRYMIYSMGFFYTAGCMVLYDVWQYVRMKHDADRGNKNRC